MVTPKRLVFDVEVSPMLVYAWQLGKQDIDYKRIYKERQVLCIGYAFDDEPVQVLTLDYDQFNLHQKDNDADKELVLKFSELVQQADVVIGHNIKRYDIAVLRSRMIRHQVPDFAPLLVDDTYLQTRGVGFASHKLDYMTGFLGLERKKDHPFEMWIDVVMKVPGAFENMKGYCVGDVESTRQMYNRLRPYIKSSLSMAVFRGQSRLCPECGSKHVQSRGRRMTRTGKFNRYTCMDCGHWWSDGKNLLKRGSAYPR